MLLWSVWRWAALPFVVCDRLASRPLGIDAEGGLVFGGAVRVAHFFEVFLEGGAREFGEVVGDLLNGFDEFRVESDGF